MTENVLRRGVRLARRASDTPPRVVARRLVAEASVELERLRGPRRAQRLDEAGLLARTGAPSLAGLWLRLVARAPLPGGLPRLDKADHARVVAAADKAVARRIDLL